MAVAEVGIEDLHQALALVMGIGPYIHLPFLIAGSGEAVLVGVAGGQEGLGGGARLQPFGSVAGIYGRVTLPRLVAVFHVEVYCRPLRPAQSAGRVAVPLVLLSRLVVVGQVVGIGRDGNARVVAMAHDEEAAQVGRLILPQTRASLYVY